MKSFVQVRWRSLNGESVEDLDFKINNKRILAKSTITNKGSSPFVARYTIVCDLLGAQENLKLN